jgi:hypothetical protein
MKQDEAGIACAAWADVFAVPPEQRAQVLKRQ